MTTLTGPAALAGPLTDFTPTLSIAVLDPAAMEQAPTLEAALVRREERAVWGPGPGRVELFRYRDLLIRIASGSAVGDGAVESVLAARLGIRFEQPRPFYRRHLVTGPAPAEAFSAIVVNRMPTENLDRVAELFADLDATDFPTTMGTRSRELYSVAPDIYLHVQEFGQQDGLAVIDEAWRDSDPRFVRICEDLTPLVPPYDDTCTTHEDHIAERFHVRTTA